MRKVYFWLCVILVSLISGVTAQSLEDYQLSVLQNEVYESIAPTGTLLTDCMSDDDYDVVTMPFSFQLGTTTLASGASLYVCSNGYLTVGSGVGNTSPSWSGTYGVVAPLAHDLDPTDGSATQNTGVYYQVSGTAPERTLTVEWRDVPNYGGENRYNFQVKFYEGTHVLEFCYGTMSLGESESAAVGLRDVSDNANLFVKATGGASWTSVMLSLSSTVQNMNISSGNAPNNLTYRFTPVVPTCLRPFNLATSVSTDGDITLSWSDTTGATQWEAACVTPGEDPANSASLISVSDTFVTFAGLAQSSFYQLYVRTNCGGEVSGWRSVTAHTPCAALTSLPYQNNFDNEGTGSSAFPACWTKINTYSSSYPYIYSHSSAPSSPAVLRFYSSTSTYNIAVMPALADGVNMADLQLTFTYYKSGSSTTTVGVMTDPADANTFEPLVTLPNTSSAWVNYEVLFDNYTDTGRYIAFRHVGTSTTYIDNVKLDYAPLCSPVTGLSVSNVTENGAFVTWSPGSIGTPSSYVVEYAESGTGNWTSQTVTTPYVVVSGLNSSTSYTVRVNAECESGDQSDLETVSFATTDANPCFLEVSGTSSGSYLLPLNNYYNNSYTQQIFKAEELAGLTEISGIGFQYLHTSSMTEKNNVTVYLGHTNLSSIQSEFSPVPLSALSMVYHGSLNCHAGWNYFPFDTVFTYDGISNLVLAVLDNSGSYDGNSYTFAVHTAGNNASVAYYSDDMQIPANAPTSSDDISSQTSSLRNNTRFLPENCTCPVPSPVVAEVASRSVTVVWLPGGSESLWEAECLRNGTTQWVSLGTFTDMQLFIDTLLPATSYSIRVRALCGGDDNSAWQTVTFTTDCEPMSIPYADNFDTYGTSSTSFPGCWSMLKSYTGSYPRVDGSNTSSNVFSAPGAMVFYSTSSTYEMAVMPELDEQFDITRLRAEFKLKQSSLGKSFVIGVLSDPNNDNTFVPVDTVQVSATNVFESFAVSFAGYTGNGRYIAFRHSGTYYDYMDNLTLYDTSCLRPDSVWAEDVTSNSLKLNWTSTGDASAWNVQYGPHGFALGQGTVLEAYSTTEMLAGLPSNSQLDFYVQSDCGDVQSAWTGPLAVTLVCSAIEELPYTENFDSYGTGNATAAILPPCWERLSSSNYAHYPYVATTAFSTPGSLYFYGTGSNYSMVVMPEISNTYPLNTLKASFKYMTASGNFQLEVGVMEDSVFVPVDTVTYFNGSWNDYDVYFASYAGNGQRIAFKCPSGIGRMDDLTIAEAEGCSTPLQLQVSVLGGDTVQVSWVDNSTASSWVVEYGEQGFQPGNGSTVTVSEHTALITGLSSNMFYDFYVKTDCEGAAIAGPVNVLVGSHAVPAVGSATLYSCDAYITDDGGYAGNYSDNADGMLTVYADSPNNALVLSGEVYAENGYDFLYIYEGAGVNGILLGTYSMGSFSELVVPSGVATLHFTSDGSTNNSGFLIHVTCMATLCDAPANLGLQSVTSSATTVGWSGNASSYTLIYGPQYFNPATGGTTVNGITDTFYVFNGLTTGNVYDFYVMADCDGGGNSLIAGPLTFSAGCVTMPVTGTQSVTTCGITIYDNGGMNGPYANNSDATLIIYPEAGNAVTLSGSVSTETNYDILYIYDGAGLTGTPLGIFEGDMNVPLLTSTSGPLTLHFVSDGSVNYDGFALTTGCVSLSCPQPANVTVSVDNNLLTATVAWTPGGSESEWELGYKLSGTTQWTDVQLTTPSYTISGLASSSVYDLRLKAVCGAGDESMYVTMIFNTACGTVTSYPYEESFESGVGCWTVSGNSSNSFYWRDDYTTDDDLSYDFGNTTYLLVPSGNKFMFFGADDNDQYYFSRLTSPVFDLSTLSDPYLKFTHIQALWSSDQDTLGVFYRTSSTDTWHYLTSFPSSIESWTVDSVALPASNNTAVEISFLGAASFGYGIGLDLVTVYDNAGSGPVVTNPTVATNAATAVAQSSATLNGTVTNPDNVTVTAKGFQWKATTGGTYATVNATGPGLSYNLTGLSPATNYTFRAFITFNGQTVYGNELTFTTLQQGGEPCDVPTGVTASNITAEGATITWDANAGVDSWNIQYRPQSGQLTSATSNTNSYTITGLTASTTYDVQVQAVCDGNNTSEWSANYTFTTTTGLENRLENSIVLSPNPANSMLNVKWAMGNEDASIELFDVYGKLLQTLPVAGEITVINVSNLADGMYFVRVTTEQGAVTKSFVKR